MLRKSMIVLATVLGVGSAHAQIKVGITMSASGPGAAIGQPQSKTVAALPKEIAGQKITYFALDDESIGIASGTHVVFKSPAPQR